MTDKIEPPQRKFSDQQWREDLHFMSSGMKSIHPNLFHAVLEDTFQHEVNKLAGATPYLTDNEVIVGLLKLTAMTKDWHTQVISSNLTERWFPIRIDQLQDGLFIVASSPEYAQYLGARVLKIGSYSADAAFDKVEEVTAHDNRHSQRYFAPMLMSMASVLHGLHIIDDTNVLRLEIQPLTGEQRRIKIAAEEFESDDDLSWYWREEKAPAKECITVATHAKTLPLYWRNLKQNYWFEFLEQYRTVYLGFNMTLNDETESFADFNARLWDLINRQATERLIIDLRHNLGGDHDILPPLIEGILQCDRINRQGALFVLIGPKNVSASAHCATWLEKKTHATFVGEPTGARPNQYADAEQLRLPNSQLRVMISKVYWLNSTPDDDREWIEPHISACFDSVGYFSLKDPVMEKVLGFSE